MATDNKKISTIIPNDITGLRNNMSEILELAQKKELEAIIITYRRDDGSMHTYWNGGDMMCIALSELGKADVLRNYEETEGINYKPLPTKDQNS